MAGSYENTISGLMKKRVELLKVVADLQDQSARAANDIRNIDRVLQAFGHVPEPDKGEAPRTRIMLFIRNEMRRFIIDHLRQTKSALSSRNLALVLAEADGKDITDRRLMCDITKRVSKTVSILVLKGVLTREKDNGNTFLYRLNDKENQ